MYPQQPQQFQPTMPQYPQGYPQAPQFPVNPGYPAPATYPAQGYPHVPAQPLPSGSLDDFFDQRSASGPSWKFKDKPIGTAYAGVVARPVTNADVQAQTDQAGNVQTYKDGRPKFVMIVPMTFPPTAEHPDGQAGWYVKGQARDELSRAMAEAGAPAGAPEAGAAIRVTLVGHRPIPGFNPAFQYRVEYVRPQGAGAQQIPAAAPVQQAPPMQAQAPMPAPQQIPAAAPVQVVAEQAPIPVPQQVPQAPAGLSPDQQALFAKLTGQPQG